MSPLNVKQYYMGHIMTNKGWIGPLRLQCLRRLRLTWVVWWSVLWNREARCLTWDSLKRQQHPCRACGTRGNKVLLLPSSCAFGGYCRSSSTHLTARYPLTHISMNHLNGVASIFPPMIITISSVSLISGSQPRFPPGELSNMNPKSEHRGMNTAKHGELLGHAAFSEIHIHLKVGQVGTQTEEYKLRRMFWRRTHQCGWDDPGCPAWCFHCVGLLSAAGRAAGCKLPYCGWSCTEPERTSVEGVNNLDCRWEQFINVDEYYRDLNRLINTS